VQTFTDLYRYRFILSNLVDKELKSQYRNQSLGFIWALLNPLVMVLTLTMVWTYMFSAKPDFAAMVVVVLIPYNFFAYCLSGCTSSILANETLVKRIRFPRQILPISVIVTHLIHLAVQSTLVLAAVTLLPTRGDALGLHLLWLPIVVAIQLGLVVGVGLMVAALNVFYRDVQYLVDSLLTMLFWVSPVVYSLGETGFEKTHGPLAFYAYHLNPLAGLLEGYRSILWYGEAPRLDTLAMSAGITLIIGYMGVRIFWRRERDFADMM
jgi:lipopolysaccharide transport system permease protein